MRLATEHDYRRRTARVAEHLAAHLDAPLDLVTEICLPLAPRAVG